MLEFLRIRNLALIQDMELEFAAGLNVLTGESGAGKSFILRALDFLLGERLAADMVRPGEEKAQVEAVFVLPDEELLLRRELSANSGRSRVFVNDALSSQERIKELRPTLIIHTSQHAQQKLLKPAYHTRLLDGFVPDALLKTKEQRLEGLRQVLKQKKELAARAESLKEKRDFLEYQQQAIAKVSPKEGEEEELEAKRLVLKNQSLCQEHLQRALELLHGQDGGIIDQVHELKRSIEALAGVEESFASQAEALEEFRINLQEMDRSLRRMPLPEAWEKELEAVEARLWQLAQLKRKLGRSLSDITRLRSEVEDNLSFLDKCELELAQLEKSEAELTASLNDVVTELNGARKHVSDDLAGRLQEGLTSLGFSEQVQVTFEFFPVELCLGVDELRARLLFVPNPGHPPQPLDAIASGGELSRFLLALVGLMSRENLPTLLFDEVDAGIGGKLLGRVGERLLALAEKQQVVLVSHWPQLASLAGCHFKISKEVQDGMTFTLCERLDREEVLGELARMAGGGKQGQLLAEILKSEASSGLQE